MEEDEIMLKGDIGEKISLGEAFNSEKYRVTLGGKIGFRIILGFAKDTPRFVVEDANHIAYK